MQSTGRSSAAATPKTAPTTARNANVSADSRRLCVLIVGAGFGAFAMTADDGAKSIAIGHKPTAPTTVIEQEATAGDTRPV